MQAGRVPEEVVVTHGTQEIRHLEDSISQAQGVLDGAQRLLGDAERAGAWAESARSKLRRTALTSVVIFGVFALLFAARHRHSH